MTVLGPSKVNMAGAEVLPAVGCKFGAKAGRAIENPVVVNVPLVCSIFALMPTTEGLLTPPSQMVLPLVLENGETEMLLVGAFHEGRLEPPYRVEGLKPLDISL